MAIVMRSEDFLRQGLVDLSRKLVGNGLTMIEVGSYAGESAEIFAKSGRFAKILCIDPWITDPDGDNMNSYTEMDDVEREFDAVAGRNPVIEKFKGTLDTFVASDVFRGMAGTIDFVYIDANHTYEACKHDIEMVMEHVKPRQIVAGHDYGDIPEHIRGVKKAVNEIFGQPDETFSDSSWCRFLTQ